MDKKYVAMGLQLKLPTRKSELLSLKPKVYKKIIYYPFIYRINPANPKFKAPYIPKLTTAKMTLSSTDLKKSYNLVPFHF